MLRDNLKIDEMPRGTRMYSQAEVDKIVKEKDDIIKNMTVIGGMSVVSNLVVQLWSSLLVLNSFQTLFSRPLQVFALQHDD